MGRRWQEHRFCSVCGVSVYIEKLPVSAEEVAKWPDSRKKLWPVVLPVNLRCLEGVEWERVEVYYSKNALELEPKYVVN